MAHPKKFFGLLALVLVLALAACGGGTEGGGNGTPNAIQEPNVPQDLGIQDDPAEVTTSPGSTEEAQTGIEAAEADDLEVTLDATQEQGNYTGFTNDVEEGTVEAGN